MKFIPRFLLLSCFVFSVAFMTPASADEPASSTTTTTVITSTTTTTHNVDGSTTILITNSDGSSSTTVDKTDGTIITTKRKSNGSYVQTIDNVDGSSVITTHNADGSSSTFIENIDGSWKKIITASGGEITTETSDILPKAQPSNTPNAAPTSSPIANSSSTPSPDPEASPSSSPAGSPSGSATPVASPTPAPSPTPTPSPTPPPSKAIVAPFYIDRVKNFLTKDDANQFFLISTSCITVDQWAAFLNAVAKYSDKHGLYYPAMANLPQAKKDSSGNITTPAPKLAQIVRNLSEDKKGYVYTVANRDSSACIVGAIEMKNKDLPVTYINLFDAARFCNWLHHGQPLIGEGQDPDSVTEGGAYLIDDGLNTNWRDTHQALPGYKDQYQDQFKAITLLSTALWRIPSYYDYNGVHHVAGKNKNVPDFTEPGNDFSNQVVPADEVNGFFDNDYKNWLGTYAHYEWTSTHCSSPSEAERFHRDAQLVGTYYKVKSPSDEVKEYATTSKSIYDRGITKDQDSETSFRVMPLLSAIDELPPEPVPIASPEAVPEPPSPDASVSRITGDSPNPEALPEATSSLSPEPVS